MTRQYSDSYIINHDDIIQLSFQIRQFCEQFSIKGYSETVSIEHYGTKERMLFSSIDKFRTYQTSIKEPTSQLILTVNFLISNPNYGKYQNYRIDIEINSYKLLKDMKNLRYHYDGNRSPISSKIEYVDYTVGKSFSSVVEGWVNNLDLVELKKRPKIFSYFEEMPNSFFAVVAAILFVTSLPLAFVILKIMRIDIISSLRDAVLVVYVSLAVSGLSYFLARVVSEFVEYKMWIDGNFCFSIMNDGDKRNYQLFIDKNLKLQRRYNYIIFGMILASMINIFSNYLYDAIK